LVFKTESNKDAEACGEVSMFESVRQTSHLDSAKHFLALLLSLVIHAAALCTLALLPLLFLNVIHQGDLLTFLIAPPPPPPPPAPAPPRPAGASVRHAIVLTNINATPNTIPRGIPDPPQDADVDVGSILPNIAQGVAGVGPAGVGQVAMLFPMDPMNPVPPPPPPSRDKKNPPLKISSGVLAGKLIFKVDPEYPSLARIARVSGSVIMEATIDEEGNVAEIKVLSGHILLNEAAVEAVKRWKYSPTVLNGEPIKVQAAITVNFNLR
jgi:periplasmic protein TonB